MQIFGSGYGGDRKKAEKGDEERMTQGVFSLRTDLSIRPEIHRAE